VYLYSFNKRKIGKERTSLQEKVKITLLAKGKITDSDTGIIPV
jgi:hypothetical protein